MIQAAIRKAELKALNEGATQLEMELVRAIKDALNLHDGKCADYLDAVEELIATRRELVEAREALSQANKYLKVFTNSTVVKRYFRADFLDKVRELDPLVQLIRPTEKMHGYCWELGTPCAPDCPLQGVDGA